MSYVRILRTGNSTVVGFESARPLWNAAITITDVIITMSGRGCFMTSCWVKADN
jgi:hypothetical protein